MSDSEQIKEGDNVRVPIVSGSPTKLSSYGKVLYLQPPIAVVQLQYGTRIMRQAFNINDLIKVKMTTEQKAKERYEQETA